MLVPFIEDKNSGDEILFWPDLASCHYARETQELLQEMDIPLVPKTDNPPCCPKLRPIEDVWSMLKAKTYAVGWKATNDTQLIRKIKKSISVLDQEVLHKMMRGCHSACDTLHVQESIPASTKQHVKADVQISSMWKLYVDMLNITCFINK